MIEYIPLLFEEYNHSGRYMNHHNWNGGLWDRVIFDEYGIPKVQYSDGLKICSYNSIPLGFSTIQ